MAMKMKLEHKEEIRGLLTAFGGGDRGLCVGWIFGVCALDPIRVEWKRVPSISEPVEPGS